jgi:hypothetical protein
VIWPVGTYPLLNANQSTRAVMAAANEAIGADGQLGLVAWREENLLQARRPVVEFGFARDAAEQLRAARAWQAADPVHRYIFANDDALDACTLRENVRPLGTANRVHFVLLPANATKPGCTPQ